VNLSVSCKAKSTVTMLAYLRLIGFSMVAIHKMFHTPQSTVLAGVSLSMMSFDKVVELRSFGKLCFKHAMA
jgi:hypothetical protein